MINKKGQLPTPLMLFARILVGGYLLYTAYEVFQSSQQGGDDATIFLIFSIVFAVVGVIGVYLGLKDVIKGYYKGGPMDISQDEDEEAIDVEGVATEAVDETTSEAGIIE